MPGPGVVHVPALADTDSMALSGLLTDSTTSVAAARPTDVNVYVTSYGEPITARRFSLETAVTISRSARKVYGRLAELLLESPSLFTTTDAYARYSPGFTPCACTVTRVVVPLGTSARLHCIDHGEPVSIAHACAPPAIESMTAPPAPR